MLKKKYSTPAGVCYSSLVSQEETYETAKESPMEGRWAVPEWKPAHSGEKEDAVSPDTNFETSRSWWW